MLNERLSLLGDKIFTKETVSVFPILEALRWEVEVQKATRALIPIEIDREKRARNALKTADKHVQDCIRYIREILKLGMDMGVPQNNKHHQKLFSGSALEFADKSMPWLLRCKTSVSEFFTNVARARVRQVLVLQPPLFELPDLSHLAGRSKVRAMDELGMYAKMESSYAQCQFCRTYVAREISSSVAREKALLERQTQMSTSIETAERDVRAAQCIILLSYTQGIQHVQSKLSEVYGTKAAQFYSLAPDQPQEVSTESPKVIQVSEDTPSARPSTLPPYNSDDSISAKTETTHSPIPGMSLFLYKMSRARLHALLREIDAQTRVEDTEEDLPWHNLALGW